MSFIVLVTEASGFDKMVNEVLPVSERCHCIKFVEHRPSSKQDVKNELLSMSCVWSRGERQPDETESQWTSHGYAMKRISEHDVFPEAWIEKVVDEGKPFFLFIETPTSSSPITPVVSKFFLNKPRILENALVIFTSLQNTTTSGSVYTNTVPMVMWSSKLFSTPTLEVGTTVEYNRDERWNRATVLQSTNEGCTLRLEDESAVNVSDFSRVRLITANVERLFTSNADIAPTIRGIIRATSSAKAVAEPRSRGSSGRDLSHVLLGTKSSRSYLERDNLSETDRALNR